MKFVPKYVRQSVDCIAAATDVFPINIQKATMEWIGSSIEVTRCVHRVNYEKKLKRRGILRKSDWKKIEKLFSGWGSGDNNVNLLKNIGRQLSEARVEAMMRKEELERNCEKVLGDRVKKYFENYQVTY